MTWWRPLTPPDASCSQFVGVQELQSNCQVRHFFSLQISMELFLGFCSDFYSIHYYQLSSPWVFLLIAPSYHDSSISLLLLLLYMLTSPNSCSASRLMVPVGAFAWACPNTVSFLHSSTFTPWISLFLPFLRFLFTTLTTLYGSYLVDSS